RPRQPHLGRRVVLRQGRYRYLAWLRHALSRVPARRLGRREPPRHGAARPPEPNRARLGRYDEAARCRRHSDLGVSRHAKLVIIQALSLTPMCGSPDAPALGREKTAPAFAVRRRRAAEQRYELAAFQVGHVFRVVTFLNLHPTTAQRELPEQDSSARKHL